MKVTDHTDLQHHMDRQLVILEELTKICDTLSTVQVRLEKRVKDLEKTAVPPKAQEV